MMNKTGGNMMLSEVLERCLREIQTPTPVAPAIDPLAATQKQIDYFKALVEGKELTARHRTDLLTALPTFDKRTMTQMIQWLSILSWTPRPLLPPQFPPMPSVPGPVQTTILKTQDPVWNGRPMANGIAQGYYAIVDPADQVLKFYHVRRPTQGKWVGYVFIDQVSGDNKIAMRDRNERGRIFTEIQKDILGALKRFGKEIGQCGHCRKQLTDAVSREFGIGPVCRKVLGV
jgi:hypothetical protein